MPAVSVLVTTLNPGPDLADLVRSVDGQTMPASEFDLVVVDASDDGTAGRLEQLAARRPNVVVLAGDAQQSEADRIGAAFERATGEYVLLLTRRQQLAPRALELLLDRARRTAADIVVGRAVAAAASGSTVLPDDIGLLDVSDAKLTDCVALVRRSLAADRPEAGPKVGADVGAALLDLPGLASAAATVSALGRYACAIDGAASSTPDGGVSLEPPTYRWDDGMLHLTIGVRLPGSASPGSTPPESRPADSAPSSPTGLRSWLVVSQGQVEVALPATTVGDTPSGPNGATVTVSSVLDPRTVDSGDPLQDGPWDLRLRIAWSGREATLPLTAGPTLSAVVAGRPYTVRGAGGGVQLDAGAKQTSVIGAVTRSRASIAETAGGTLVTLDHPDLHVHGDAVLDARLLLDGFSLPGHLVCHDGRARTEAYASSLAGISKVSVLAGGGKPVPTGLRLRVDGTGRMALEDAPSAAPKPSAPSTAAGAPLVQRLRRRLPGTLDPALQRLVQVPVVRQAYRRLINR